MEQELNVQTARDLFIRVFNFNQKKREIAPEFAALQKIGKEAKKTETLIDSLTFRSKVGLSQDFSGMKARIMTLTKAEIHYLVTDFVQDSGYMHCVIVLHLFLKDAQEKDLTKQYKFPLTRMNNAGGSSTKTYMQERIVATNEVGGYEIKFANEQSFHKLQNFCSSVIFVLNQELPIDKQFWQP